MKARLAMLLAGACCSALLLACQRTPEPKTSSVVPLPAQEATV